MTRQFQVTFDCADPAALAAFWAEVLGYEVQAPPEGFDSWPAALAAFGVPESEWNSRSAILPSDGAGPRVFFQRVPEGKSVKNRLHLDVRVATELRGDERMAALRPRRIVSRRSVRHAPTASTPPHRWSSASSPCTTPRTTSSASTDAQARGLTHDGDLSAYWSEGDHRVPGRRSAARLIVGQPAGGAN